MDLREEIVEAVRNVLIRLGPNAIANAQDGHKIRLSGNEAEQFVDAVMEKVRELEYENKQLQDEVTEDDGVIRLLRRQRDEAESDLDAATRFEIGAAEVHRTRGGAWAICVDGSLEEADTRDAALARARDIVKKEA